MQQSKYYKFTLIVLGMAALSFNNVSTQVWDSFWLTESAWTSSGIISVLSCWGMPMIIAGVGMIYLSDISTYSVKHIVLHKLPRAFIGCIVWWTVSALVYLKYNCANELDTDTFFECLSKVLDAPYNVSFLQMVVMFFAFYPLLKKIECNQKLSRYALAIYYLMVAVLPALKMIPYVSYITLFTDQINWGFFTSFGLYLFIGIFISKSDFEWHQRIVIYCTGVLATVAMFCLTIFFSAEEMGYDTRFVSLDSPLVACQVTAIAVMVKRLFSNILSNTSKLDFLKDLAKATYGFVPMFAVSQEIMSQIISVEGMPISMAIVIESVICFTVAISFSFSIRKLPIFSYFTV